MCSNFLNCSIIDMLPILKKIMEKNIPVWIFSGDKDSVIPLISSRTPVWVLAQDLNFKTTVPYGAWFHKDRAGGWAIEYGELLTFATVRGAAENGAVFAAVTSSPTVQQLLAWPETSRKSSFF